MPVNSIYLLYAFLAAGSLYMTLLILCIPRLPGGRRIMAFSNFSLFIAFGILALGRSQILGFSHGQNPWVARSAFACYGLTLLVIFVRYWLFIWHLRCGTRKSNVARIGDEEPEHDVD